MDLLIEIKHFNPDSLLLERPVGPRVPGRGAPGGSCQTCCEQGCGEKKQ
jgi:hypothetical protein